MSLMVKDKIDFLNKYEYLREMVFFREVNDKVHIKISCPAYSKIAKQLLNKIKD